MTLHCNYSIIIIIINVSDLLIRSKKVNNLYRAAIGLYIVLYPYQLHSNC